MFSISMAGITILALVLIFVLATRSPVVLTLNPNAQPINQVSLPNPELEVQSAMRRYLELRYQWTPETVKQKLAEALSMIHLSAMKAYLGAAANVVKFSTEKLVSQRVYATILTVDLRRRNVQILGDRITAIQSLKAAGDLKLELSFDFGPRTKENPWGIYVTKELEKQ
ncbi:MAG: hypothetical protein SGJ18_02225 [Pseudomonadota bacterium]|nr:hypothetical protein [Pseudomonadota bacterium]